MSTFQSIYYWEISYSCLRLCFNLSILESLYMPKIMSTILKKVFWITKEETTLVCLPVKPLHVLVLSLALTSLFVCSSTFVLTFRKELPNLSFCKFWFYFITVITIIVKFLNFDIHSPPHFKNNSMEVFKRSTLIIINFIILF